MRLAFLLATLGLLIAPLRPAAAQRAGPPASRREPPPKTPARPPSQGSSQPVQPPPPQPTGHAPDVPPGITAAEAAAPVPETGVITKIEIQGNRRVAGDAIRAAIPMNPGDTSDTRQRKDTLRAGRG